MSNQQPFEPYNATSYSQQGYSSPQPDYQPPQQGYPYSQPNYPPPQQGYPSPQQGYPPPQQGYLYPQQGYSPQVEVPLMAVDTRRGQALAGLILGIISMIAWLLPILGFPIAIVGIVFASLGMRSTTRKGMAIAGLILAILALVLTIINSMLGVYLATRNG